MTSPSTTRDSAADPPATFFAHLRALGPGLVAVLTWLGAGDIVTAAIAGGNYGYSLSWALVLALATRWFFVSTIARFQLANPHGRSVVEGLAAVHRLYPALIVIGAIVSGHLMNAYMLVGLGELTGALVGGGAPWAWALAWAALTFALVDRAAYAHIERVFKVLLALLSASLIGGALWVGPDLPAIAGGLVTLAVPPQLGGFDATLVVLGMIGAVGGSLTNLTYPYFLAAKGWRGPAFLPVQRRDFLLAAIVVVVLSLSVWTLGAELVHASGRTIADLEGLTALLSALLGPAGRRLFELGLVAAIFTSLLGVTLGFGLLARDAARLAREPASAGEGEPGSRRRWTLWLVGSPLVWTFVGGVDFVGLTLLANALAVPLMPALAGGLWRMTASPRHIGREHANSRGENLAMAVIFALSVWGAIEAVRSIVAGFGG